MRARPARVTGAEERLDAAEHDARTLETSLGHIAAINRWLGGWRSLRRHLPGLLPTGRTGRILDVGTGSGDAARVIARWARRHRREVEIVATDVHPQMLETARRRTADLRGVRVERADALSLPYADGEFDVAMLLLALHHFEGEDAVRVLSEMGRVARAVLVSDLDRSWLNYAGARLLAATYWRGNPLTRHDGPLSVLRAYTAAELLELATAAGLRRPRVYRHVLQRLVLVAGGAAMEAASLTE